MRKHRNLAAVSLVGGLGNQLFQFAVAKALLADPSDPAALDDRLCRFWGAPLTTVLADRSYRPVTQTELLILRQAPRSRRGQRTLMKHDSSSRRFTDAPALGYDSRVMSLPRPVLLRGHFQSEDYFKGRADAVADSFQPLAVTDYLDAIARVAGKRPTVALSVRTGPDYEEFGCVLDPAYQVTAARQLLDMIGDAAFVVFGNVLTDCDRVAEALRGDAPVIVCAAAPPPTQLALMSCQTHAVVANSSFAWWGAWLGDHRRGYSTDRHVLRPDPWLQEGDPCPARWLKVTSRHLAAGCAVDG